MDHHVAIVWELPGRLGRGGSTPLNVFKPRSCACLFVLGVRCNPTDRKNVKNFKFSCQHMDF